MSGNLDVRTSDWVTTITLRRPDHLNALDAAMTLELLDVVTTLERDDNTRAVILTGEGRGFCAGADLASVAQDLGPSPSAAAARDMMRGSAARLARALYQMEKPLIAAVNGPAAGAGAAIAVTADVTIMASGAMLSFLFISRGLVPDYASTWLLPRMVGLRLARRLCLFGERLDAEQAVELGLVDRVVEPDRLLEEATQAAATFAAGAGVALRLTKRLLAESFDVGHAAAVDREFTAQALCLTSADAAEGLDAFANKRAPLFQWR